MLESNQGEPEKRVVFDANLFIQAILSGRGPAFACIGLVKEGGVELLVTESILSEIDEVLRRLSLKPRYAASLTEDAIVAFMALLRAFSTLCDEPPHVFDIPRDPDDEVYVDLAIAEGATYITSRDKDLLSLMDPYSPDGAEFLARYPSIRIVDPVEFLNG